MLPILNKVIFIKILYINNLIYNFANINIIKIFSRQKTDIGRHILKKPIFQLIDIQKDISHKTREKTSSNTWSKIIEMKN